MPLPDRLHWLKRLRHSRVKFLFSGGGYCESTIPGPNAVPAPVAGLTGDGDVIKGKASALIGTIPDVKSVRELRVCHDICAENKSSENARRPFPKALFPPPPEKVEGDEEEETEEAKKKRLKDLKKSVRQELKRGLAGAKTDEVEWGNYDDELSEDEEEDEEEEEVEKRYGRGFSSLCAILTVSHLPTYLSIAPYLHKCHAHHCGALFGKQCNVKLCQQALLAEHDNMSCHVMSYHIM